MGRLNHGLYESESGRLEAVPLTSDSRFISWKCWGAVLTLCAQVPQTVGMTLPLSSVATKTLLPCLNMTTSTARKLEVRRLQLCKQHLPEIPMHQGNPVSVLLLRWIAVQTFIWFSFSIALPRGGYLKTASAICLKYFSPKQDDKLLADFSWEVNETAMHESAIVVPN